MYLLGQHRYLLDKPWIPGDPPVPIYFAKSSPFLHRVAGPDHTSVQPATGQEASPLLIGSTYYAPRQLHT